MSSVSLFFFSLFLFPRRGNLNLNFRASRPVVHRPGRRTRHANFDRFGGERCRVPVVRRPALALLPLSSKTRDQSQGLRDGLERVSVCPPRGSVVTSNRSTISTSFQGTAEPRRRKRAAEPGAAALLRGEQSVGAQLGSRSGHGGLQDPSLLATRIRIPSTEPQHQR